MWVLLGVGVLFSAMRREVISAVDAIESESVSRSEKVVDEEGDESALSTTIGFLLRYQMELQWLLDEKNKESLLQFKQYDESLPMVWLVIFGATYGHNYTHISEVLQYQYPHLLNIFLRENQFYQQIGGGVLMGPLLLHLHVPPEVYMELLL